jgi:hypothetical protein
MPSNAFLTMVLGLAASRAAFAILVQITQEVYKYLTSSKTRAYRDALVDFIGPAAAQLLQPGAAPELFVPGPFQFRRVQPKGKLLPLSRDALVKALERTSPEWVRRGLKEFIGERRSHDSRTLTVTSGSPGSRHLGGCGFTVRRGPLHRAR